MLGAQIVVGNPLEVEGVDVKKAVPIFGDPIVNFPSVGCDIVEIAAEAKEQ